MATSKKKSVAKKAPTKAKKPAAKKAAPAKKKAPAKKVAAKKAAPAKKKPAKKIPAKKPVTKKAPPKKSASVARKSAPIKKAAPEKSEKPKKVRKSPKMVIKPIQIPVQEELYENESKDFAFAFAESMKDKQLAAAESYSQKLAESTVKLPKRPTSRAKGRETLKFSNADLAQFRKTLIALRQSIVGKTATLKTNALEQTIDRAGEDEDGSDSFMRLQNLGQVGEQNKTLQKIDEALHRIDDGTYGICNVCGQLIRKARLQHLPFAHTCMECQSAMESGIDSMS